MKLAVLFWFYKDIPLCVERLTRFRRLNPELEVFALYGGEISFSGGAREALAGLVEDFYCFDQIKGAEWKWRNGDHLIAHWYLERGVDLEWDSIFILQWDMLVLGKSLGSLLSNLEPRQLVLSGFTLFYLLSL